MEPEPTSSATPSSSPGPQPPRLLPVAVAMGVLVFFAAIFQMARNPTEDLPDSHLVGKPAPAFSLQRLEAGRENERLELTALLDEGKPVVVNMWASWCVGCKQEAADLERFWQGYEGRVNLVGFALQDELEDARAFADDYTQTYPLALDEKGRVGIDFGILGLPETFVIDAEGIVRKRFIGPVTAAQLVETVRPLLREGGGG